MNVENQSKNIIVVDLPPHPEAVDELKNCVETLRGRIDRDVIIDFSNVDILTTAEIAELLTLRNLLSQKGHRLILCSICAAVRGIFTVDGLDKVFEFADSKSAALRSIHLFQNDGRLAHS
jgi:anti-anti-sigma regulatory factor